MYSIDNNIVKIDGKHGKYDSLVRNIDVRYGRNANNNYRSYIADIGNVDKRVPLEFEYRYMPDGRLNKFALLGSAYEEMNKNTRLRVDMINKEFQKSGMSEYSMNAMDINRDGYIDISEYATGTLVQDMLSSTDGYDINPRRINGVITGKGETKAFALNNSHIENQAREVYAKLHKDFGLGQAQQEFLSDSNNLVK